MLYRLYHPDDFKALYAIEEVCFQPPLRFPRAYMRRVVGNPDSATWVAEENEQMTGFANIEWAGVAADRYAYIQTLEVLPEYRRRGVARELLSRLEQSAQQAGVADIWLHVEVSNTSAIRLYRAFGYQPRGREESYYGPGLAAEVYSKFLSTPARESAATR